MISAENLNPVTQSPHLTPERTAINPFCPQQLRRREDLLNPHRRRVAAGGRPSIETRLPLSVSLLQFFQDQPGAARKSRQPTDSRAV